MKVLTLVCVNKFDVNMELTAEVEAYCHEHGLRLIGRIPHDKVVTKAMVQGQTVVEYSSGKVAQEIDRLWRQIGYALAED